MAQFIIESESMKRYANRLNEVRRSAFPLAIMRTLNDAAFDVKERTMLQQADKTFVKRKPKFFEATSKVEMARPGQIASMKSVIGFASKTSTADQAVEDLEKQENGGKIGGRSFIATKYARSGKDWNKSTISSNRISKIDKLSLQSKARGKNHKEKFIRTALHAEKGGHILHTDKENNKEYLSKITVLKTIDKKGKRRRTIVKVKALQSFEKDRYVRVEPTHFMQKASRVTANKLRPFFIKNAEKIISRYT